MFDTIRRFLLKIMWPWFVKYVWPIIKEHLLKIIAFVVGMLKDMVIAYFDNRSKQKQDEAYQKAQQADENASKEEQDNKRAKYEAEARIWREVAEEFRKENEVLKSKMEEFIDAAKVDVSQQVSDINPQLEGSSGPISLVMGNECTPLPAISVSQK